MKLNRTAPWPTYLKKYGLVKTEQGFSMECRCENTACKYFNDCRPDYVPEKKYKGTVFLRDKNETEMKLPDLPDPVLLSPDDDILMNHEKTTLLIQLQNEQFVPSLNQEKNLLQKIVPEEGISVITDEEFRGNDQDVIIKLIQGKATCSGGPAP